MGILKNSLWFKLGISIIGIIGLLSTFLRDDSLLNCMLNGLFLYFVVLGILRIGFNKAYFLKNRNVLGIISTIIGFCIFGLCYYFELDGLFGFTLVLSSLMFIILGIISAKLIRTIFISILEFL